MYLSKAILLLGLGLAFGSCAKQEPSTSLVKPSEPTENNISVSTPRETIQFAANLSLDNHLRALEGTKFYRGRLRPYITGETVSVRVYLGSKTQAQLSPLTLNFKYDEESNSIAYRGEINVPEGLITASDLRMLMLVANEGQISSDNAKLDITRTIKSEFFDNGTFADGTALAYMKVPYSTGWLDVSGLTERNKLDVARTKVTLKPLGHVIKLEVNVTQSALEEVTFKGFRVESTAVTDRGSYTLPQDASHIGDEGTDLLFTPVLGSSRGKIGAFDLTATSEVITKTRPKAKTVFVWVAQIPSSSLQAPYKTRSERWTRAFISASLSKPVMDRTFTGGAWWDGFGGRNIPAYYSTNDFSKKGSTMSMQLDNPKVISPIDRMPHTYMGLTFADRNAVAMQDDAGHNLGSWGDREKAYQTHYSWSWLEAQNFVGDARVPITFPNSPEENSRTIKYRIPTLEELAAIFPTQSVGAGLRIVYHNGTAINVDSEVVKLGGAGSAPASYSATYQTYNNLGSGLSGALAVRFKGGDNRYKTLFQYRMLESNSKGVARNQIQTFYMGSFYPEINTPAEFRNFATNYPDATPPRETSERVLPTDARNAISGNNFRGHTYWVANPAPTSDQITYVSLDYTSPNESVQVRYQDKTDSRKRAVIVIRDF